ncbi:MAG: hypothetical protein WA477_19920 [Candidatus Sulfotelmatobacter sp.]
MVRNAIRAWVCVLLVACLAQAQQIGSTNAVNEIVPPMVSFNGMLTDINAKPFTGVVGVMFSLYKEQQGGVPLWTEMQNVRADKTGHYAVMLGSTSAHGLPADLFVSGEARWLAVQPEGQPEQPRVVLLSVPYALKAGDAQTIGGLPPSAFVMAAPGATNSGSLSARQDGGNSSTPAPPPLGGSGTTNYIPLWTPNGTTLGNSVFFQSGNKIGLGVTNPLLTLDINGSELVRGLFEMATTGFATAAKGFNSNPMNLEASSYNSSTAKYTLQHFQWQAEPIRNDTSSPSATLNLLFGVDPGAPVETGLKLSNAGIFTFASGQTFPGAGTVTSVGSGAGLTGGPITTSGSLSIATAGVTNAMLQHPSLTVAAGTDLTGGGSVSLGGTTTLNVDTSKVPQLASSNTFAATQHITGDIDVTGNVSAGSVVSGQQGIFNGSGTEGVYGQTTGTVGVLGVSNVNRSVEGDDYAVGGLSVFGDELASSGNTLGVLGQTFSPTAISVEGANFGGGGYGVYGYEDRPDTTGANAAGVRGEHYSGSSLGAGLEFASGVWGDTSDIYGVGMLATADSGNAMAVFNNSTTDTTMYITNFEESTGSAFVLDISSFYGGYCNFLANGTLSCSGGLTTVVPTESNKKVQVYSVQSPENWFEDFGSGQLAGGVARVQLETTFAQTVNVGVDYHVFVTPKGDCKGLYVTNENAGGFEVHELGGGQSNIAFDYRIVARRKGYENLRLADATEIAKVPSIKRTQGPVHRPEPLKPFQPASSQRMAKATVVAQKVR